MEYAKMTSAQLEEEYASVSRRFGELKGMGLKLDMSRGCLLYTSPSPRD